MMGMLVKVWIKLWSVLIIYLLFYLLMRHAQKRGDISGTT